MEDNIIIICGYNYLKERPDKLDYYFFNYLQNNSKYNIQFIEPIKEKLDEIINKNSILILFTCHFDVSDYKNYKTPKMISIFIDILYVNFPIRPYKLWFGAIRSRRRR